MTGADLLILALAVGADNAYAGTVTHVQDGDTVHVAVVDALLSVPVVLAVRVAGVNANELSEPGGPEARDALTALLPVSTLVTLRHVHPDKFSGRIVGQLVTGLGVDVGPWLIANGWAAPWNGTGVKPRTPWPRPADLP